MYPDLLINFISVDVVIVLIRIARQICICLPAEPAVLHLLKFGAVYVFVDGFKDC